MDKSAQYYLEWANEEQVAAAILHLHVAEAPHLYQPTLLLLRHTIELELKGLIIDELKRAGRTRVDSIRIGEQKLTEVHSLRELWQAYLRVATVKIDVDARALICEVIEKLERKDPVLQRYRYPYARRTQDTAAESAAPDLPDGAHEPVDIAYNTMSSESTTGSEKRAKLPKILTDALDVTEILFNLSDWL